MLSISHLSKSFSGNHLVLDDVSFKLPSTGLFCIVGKSGAGKSTLLNCIGGLDDFERGTIVLDGISIGNLTGKERNALLKNEVSFCFQDSNLFPELSVLENLLFLGPKKEDRKRAEAILSSLGLEGFESKRVNEISGGEQERVAVARCLYKNARLILADEPTGSLDEESAKAVFSALKKASETALVIVVTHSLSLAGSYSSGVLKIENGRIQDCPFEENLDQQSSMEISNSYSMRVLAQVSKGHLKKTPVKIVLASLLFGICFASLMPAVDTALRSEPDLLFQGISDSTSRYVALKKNKYSLSKTITRNFLDSDVFDKVDADVLRPLYRNCPQFFNFSACSFGSYDLTDLDAKTPWWTVQYASQGFVGISPKDDILAGKAPQDETQCGISFLEYEAFAKFGFGNRTLHLTPSQISTPESFLAFSPTVHVNTGGALYSLQIVGIIDTHFDESYYGSEFFDENKTLSDIKNDELSEEMISGPHAAVFLSPSVINEFFPAPLSFSLPLGGSEEATLDLGNGALSYSYSSFQDKSNATIVSLQSGEGEGIYLPLGAFGDLFKDLTISGERIDYSSCLAYGVPFSSVKTPLNDLSYATVFSSYSPEKESTLSLLACGEYVSKNGLPSGEQLNNLIAFAQKDYDMAYQNGHYSEKMAFSDRSASSDDLLRSYWASYLASPYLHSGEDTVRLEGGYFENSFSSLPGLEITKNFAEGVLQDVSSRKAALSLMRGSNVLQKQEYPVLGLSLAESYSESCSLTLNSSSFQSLRSQLGDSGSIFLYYFDKNDASLLKRALQGKLKNSSFMALPEHRVITSYRQFHSIVGDGLRLLACVISSASAVLSILFLALLFYANREERSHEYALAESLGLAKKQLFLWSFLESFPVAFFGLAFAFVFDALFIPLVNTHMADVYGIAFSALSFSGIGLALCLFGFLFLAAFFAFLSQENIRRLSLRRRLS